MGDDPGTDSLESAATSGRIESAPMSSTAEAPLTRGSLWKAIWIMSWPLLVTTVCGSISGMVDVQVAGYLGPAAQAAVGLSEQIIFLFMIFIMSVSVGTTALVSRAFGAGDKGGSVLATAQSLVLSLMMGTVLALAALATAALILPVFSSSAAVIAQGRLYLSIFAGYLVPFSILSIINAAFRAIGDAKTPLAVVLAATTVTIAGDYLTVLGNWPVPGLGIKGIALSAVAGSTVGGAIALWRLQTSVLKESLLALFPVLPGTMARIVNVGVPSAFQRLGWAGAVFVLFFILSRCPHPTEALASWTIGMRVEGLIFMPLMAFSLAVSSIVGQNLGARRVRRAFRAGWQVTWIGVGLMLVLATAIFILAEPFARLMSQDRQTITFTTSYLRINALAEPFLAVAMILGGALQGAGDTRTPMWISIVCNWVVRLPLAWLLCLTLAWGPDGAWIAMTVSVIMMGLLTAWRFQSGGWIKVRV